MEYAVSSGAAAAVASAVTGGALGEAARAYLATGSPFMVVNVVALAAALGLTLERAAALFFRFSLPAAPFMERVGQLVAGGNVDRALRLCAAHPGAPLARVVEAGLRRAAAGEAEVAKAVQEALLEHRPRLTARIVWLWSVAGLAVLIGLGGTVAGVVRVLQTLPGLAPALREEALARGLTQALMHLGFALVTAATCVLFHLLLAAHARAMVHALELQGLRLTNLLARAAGRASSPPGARLRRVS